MARKFLYVLAVLISLSIGGMIAFSFFGEQLMRQILVPRIAYQAPAALPAGFYERGEGWLSRPDGRRGDPALWTPPGARLPEPAISQGAAIFFVHPTSSTDTLRWNARVDDANAAAQAERYVRLQATALAAAGRVWVPRYRQAVFGAFLADRPDARKAIDTAYDDVRAAFTAFLAAHPDGPIIAAGHSQGSLHLLRLLAERVGGTEWRRRLVAVYAVGWPVSIEHDLPSLDLPACTAPRQIGCILSWQSFGAPAETGSVDSVFDAGLGFDGKPRRGSHMLCTNPLTGGGAAQAAGEANLGLLSGDGDPKKTAFITPGGVGARCYGRGYLLLDPTPRFGALVLPGNNYHVYDYPLFWANVRADALARLAAWQAAR